MTTTKGLRIAAFAGVPIYISWSWWFFAALLLIVFRPTFAQALPAASTGWSWAMSGFFVLIMFATVLVHEVAHALAALSFRWKVHEITLNFWGGATTFQHGARGKAHSPLRALTVAIAGPISNLLIALLAWGLLQLLVEPAGTTRVLLTVTVFTNALIGVFNLLPGLPLDGGQVVESAVWAATGSRARGMRAAGWSGRIIMVLLLVGGILVPWLRTGELSLYGTLIAVLIGTMLWQAASAAIATAGLQLRAEALRLVDVMTPVHTIPAHTSIAELAAIFTNRRQHGSTGAEYQYVATAIIEPATGTQPEQLIGLVDPSAVSTVPATSWQLPVTTVARRVNPAVRIGLDGTLEELFGLMGHYPHEIVSVVDPAHQPPTIVGFIDPAQLVGKLHA